MTIFRTGRSVRVAIVALVVLLSFGFVTLRAQGQRNDIRAALIVAGSSSQIALAIPAQ